VCSTWRTRRPRTPSFVFSLPSFPLSFANFLRWQTPDRLEILSLISGQAAATIEKARLVADLKKTNQTLERSQAALEASNRNLEHKIADRTLELRHNNELLQAEVAEKERAQAEMRVAKEVAESVRLFPLYSPCLVVLTTLPSCRRLR
jgi:hypothetical protein